MRLLVEGHANTRAYLVDELGVTEPGGDQPWRRIDEIPSSFVSVFYSEADYRDLVAWLGFNEAIGCLRRMHDAVLARLEGDLEDAEIARLTQTIAFHQSALRDNGTWIAFRQGDRYLTPNRPPDVDDAAISFDVEAELRGM
jgi:hypothetical protein